MDNHLKSKPAVQNNLPFPCSFLLLKLRHYIAQVIEVDVITFVRQSFVIEYNGKMRGRRYIRPMLTSYLQGIFHLVLPIENCLIILNPAF